MLLKIMVKHTENAAIACNYRNMMKYFISYFCAPTPTNSGISVGLKLLIHD